MKTNKGYEPLAAILQESLDQAQNGKGQSRHAQCNEPFMNQQIMEMSRRQHNISGPAYQAHKKLYEAEGMFARGEYDAARREILGALVYGAACVLRVDEVVDDLLEKRIAEDLQKPPSWFGTSIIKTGDRFVGNTGKERKAAKRLVDDGFASEEDIAKLFGVDFARKLDEDFDKAMKIAAEAVIKKTADDLMKRRSAGGPVDESKRSHEKDDKEESSLVDLLRGLADIFEKVEEDDQEIKMQETLLGYPIVFT